MKKDKRKKIQNTLLVLNKSQLKKQNKRNPTKNTNHAKINFNETKNIFYFPIIIINSVWRLPFLGACGNSQVSRLFFECIQLEFS